MNKAAVLDFIGVLRMAAVAMAITSFLGFLSFLAIGQILPVFDLSATPVFAPWLVGGVLVAIWMTVLRLLVRRMAFFTPMA